MERAKHTFLVCLVIVLTAGVLFSASETAPLTKLKQGAGSPAGQTVMAREKNRCGFNPADNMSGFLGMTAFAASETGEEEDGQENSYPTKLKKMILGYYAVDYPGDRRSYDSLAANNEMIDSIAMFNFLTDAYGNLTAQPFGSGLRRARNSGVKCLMLVHNFNGHMDKDIAHEVLLPENRRNLECNIASLIKDYGFDGVNIDLEGVPAGDRANYSAFLEELKELLSPCGSLLTVSVPAKTRDDLFNTWSGAYDYTAIGKITDLVALMTYDEHWSGGRPGPVASLPWVRQSMDYAVRVIPREKILMGIAVYGYDWPVGPVAGNGRMVPWNSVGDLASRSGGARWNNWSSTPYAAYSDEGGDRHEVWYENKFSLDLKLDLVNNYGVAGVALWRLGFEDADFWQAVSSKFSR